MNEKMAFSNSVNDLLGMPPMSTCMSYGMTWGCDEDCPTLRAGGCHNEESKIMYFPKESNL